jgi:hypothetical protein
MCNDVHPSTSNGNSTRDATPKHCSPHQHQDHFSFDQAQISQDSLVFNGIPSKYNYNFFLFKTTIKRFR